MNEENAGISFDVIFEDSPLPICLGLEATVLDLKNQLELYTGVDKNQQMILNIPDNANDSSVLASMDLKNIEMVQVPPETTTNVNKPKDVNTMMESIVVDDSDDDIVQDDSDDDVMETNENYERIVNNRTNRNTSNNSRSVQTTQHTSTENGITTTTTTTTTITNGIPQTTTTTTTRNANEINNNNNTTSSPYTGSPNLVGSSGGYVPSPYATNFFPEADQLSAQNLIDFLEQLNYPNFSQDMFNQYAIDVPNSFSGSFKDALNFAKKRGKLLLTYLHSENEVSLAFILDILRSEEVVDFIKENFVFWVAKVTPEAESFLFSLVQFESYPIVVTLMNLGSPEILEISQGCTEKDEFFNKLVNHITSNQFELDRVRLEEEENDRARMIVQEQDQAYEESLRADKEKREKAEKEKMELENKKIAKLNKGSLVGEEPPKGPNSTQIVFKLPDDSKLERRFNSDDKIITLCNYLDGQGCEIDDYQFISMYPKRVFTEQDFNLTLKDAGLSPQSILNVRSRD